MHPERIEKNRQAIMRYRELLDILSQYMADAERAYERLFAQVTPEARAQTPLKQLQWQIAEQMGDDTEAFARAILRMRFGARDMEREFEALHDRLIEPIVELDEE